MVTQPSLKNCPSAAPADQYAARPFTSLPRIAPATQRTNELRGKAPDGRWISFRKTDEFYWSNPERMKKIYAEKPADKRPVWVVHPDGTAAHVVECLRYQCAIDGSRAAWKPLTKK